MVSETKKIKVKTPVLDDVGLCGLCGLCGLAWAADGFAEATIFFFAFFWLRIVVIYMIRQSAVYHFC